ncbi:arylsulfatase [Rubritalea profundi]|uniref:Sulfatase n=1 Tax=Rubritalea profundi TaxID=1658618 RepID=A0A2S7U1C4_9BACT|nr:arylsulfatase [Rubritalea profundi]PQJ28261.1 sulfatase [Rubritalea profundi]
MLKKNLSFTLLCLLSSPAFSASEKPNIVFILADDLGYGELGCYGQEKIKTPNIDQLAAEGMKFNYHYSGAPVCGPARCVLLTGKNLAHAEVRNNGEIKTKPKGKEAFYGGQTPLSPEAVTIAEVLKEQGYATGGFGKWGLGATWSTGSPIKQGFDRFYGYNCQRNAHSFYPAYLDSDEDQVTINKHPIPGRARQPKGEVLADTYRAESYAPDLILDEAVKFIGANKAKPFFLYLPFVEPHVAMQPHQEDINKYPKSWDTKPYRGQQGYLPHPRPRAGYAAMITDLDNHVGTIVTKLKAEGIYDNTLIIFTSDNGATTDEGGVDTQFFNSVNDLRGRKGSAYEGGLRVPMIVRWKGHIEAGTTNDTVSYFPDWFPTLTDIAGADISKSDGINLLPAFSGQPVAKRNEPMFWEFHGYGGIIAIRDGKWKAIRRGIKSKKPKNWELYDIQSDPKEKHDLAKQNPERVQLLEKSWLTSRTVNQKFPLPLVDKK